MSSRVCCIQVKRDLRMLRLRGAFDPKRFYKSADATKFPKYFQMGTVVEGPADFYSGASQLPITHEGCRRIQVMQMYLDTLHCVAFDI